MILSEYSSDFVTVLFLDIFCLLAFGDALSDLSTKFIPYGTVVSQRVAEAGPPDIQSTLFLYQLPFPFARTPRLTTIKKNPILWRYLNALLN
jgi:hypothetical protein